MDPEVVVGLVAAVAAVVVAVIESGRRHRDRVLDHIGSRLEGIEERNTAEHAAGHAERERILGEVMRAGDRIDRHIEWHADQDRKGWFR